MLLQRSALLLFERSGSVGGRLHQMGGESSDNPHHFVPWDRRGRVKLTPREHSNHIETLTRDVGDKHPTRQDSQITSGDHSRAIDALLRHHHGVIAGAAHDHYMQYRGRRARPQQVQDAFGLVTGGLLNTREREAGRAETRKKTGRGLTQTQLMKGKNITPIDPDRNPVRSYGHIRQLAKNYKRKVDSGAHEGHPNIFGAYLRTNLSNKLKSIRIEKASERTHAVEVQQSRSRDHKPVTSVKSGVVSSPEAGLDTDLRRLAIHNRIAHHIDRLEKADSGDDEAETATRQNAAVKRLSPKHIEFLRHWHEGLKQGKWGHMGADKAAESHGVQGQPGFKGNRPAQVISVVRKLMSNDPKLRRLHQEIPGVRVKAQLDWIEQPVDLFEWACRYVNPFGRSPLILL